MELLKGVRQGISGMVMLVLAIGYAISAPIGLIAAALTYSGPWMLLFDVVCSLGVPFYGLILFITQVVM